MLLLGPLTMHSKQESYILSLLQRDLPTDQYILNKLCTSRQKQLFNHHEKYSIILPKFIDNY
jgi:hypothetical protein